MRGESGQAILETSLVLPIIILLLCGIIDFGRILYTSARLNIVTQEAVRLAGLGKGDTEIFNFVDREIKANNKDAVTVTIVPGEYYRDSGDYVTLGISCDINYITPIIGRFLPSPYKVSAESTIRME